MLRSNYFAVRDVPEFFDFCDRWEFEAIQNSENLHGFLCVEDMFSEEDTLLSELADLIAADNVAVVMQVNHDRMRWLGGAAWAVNSRHERRKVSLEEIYDLAKPLGRFVTQALYCQNSHVSILRTQEQVSRDKPSAIWARRNILLL